MRLVTSIGLPVILAGVLASSHCRRAEPGSSPSVEPRQGFSTLGNRPVVSIGFLSVTKSWRALKSYQPLAEYLTAHSPYRFRIILAKSSEELLGFLEERYTEISHLGVLTYLEARKAVGAVPLAKPLNREGEPVSRSIFIARDDTTLTRLSELDGHSLALGSFHSTLGHLIPRYSLASAGIRIENLKSIKNLNDDLEVVQSVLNGRFDAGAVKDVVAYQQQRQGLRWLDISSPISSAPLVARPDLPRRISQAIVRALLTLAPGEAEARTGWNEEIRYGFVQATDADYEPVREMLHNSPISCGGQCH